MNYKREKRSRKTKNASRNDINILGRLKMRQREKINYSHCRQFSTFSAGKYNYAQFTSAWEYLVRQLRNLLLFFYIKTQFKAPAKVLEYKKTWCCSCSSLVSFFSMMSEIFIFLCWLLQKSFLFFKPPNILWKIGNIPLNTAHTAIHCRQIACITFHMLLFMRKRCP